MNTFLLSLIAILLFIFIIYFTKKYFEYINPFVEEICTEGPVMDRQHIEMMVGYYYEIKRTYKNGKVVYIRKNHKSDTKYDMDGNLET